MIGLFGGTFDPIHFGHLRAGLDVVQRLNLSELRLMPLAAAVHRRQPIATPQQRVAMVQAAIRGESCLMVDDRELVRGGPSFTADTVASVRDELGAELPICLLVGADAFGLLGDWHRPLDILAMVHLVVMQRPGVMTARDPWLRGQIDQRRVSDPTALRARPAGHILFETVTQLDISSTRIRRLLAAGESPRYLLPDAVLELALRDGYYPRSSPRLEER